MKWILIAVSCISLMGCNSLMLNQNRVSMSGNNGNVGVGKNGSNVNIFGKHGNISIGSR